MNRGPRAEPDDAIVPRSIGASEGEQPLRREEIRELAVGATSLLALVAILVISYQANRQSARIPGSGYQVSAVFNRVGGVAPGMPVQVAGIPVGAVEAIDLAPDYRARITMRIDAHIQLPRDTAAAIHTDGLFGGKFMSLEPGGDIALLQDGSAIAFTQDAVVINELLDLIIAEGRANRAAAAKGGW